MLPAAHYSADKRNFNVTNLMAVLLISQLVQMDTFDVITTDCPPGWILSTAQLEGYTTCICNFDNSDVVACNERNILLMVSLGCPNTCMHVYT